MSAHTSGHTVAVGAVAPRDRLTSAPGVLAGSGYSIALSNAMEKEGGAVLQAPSSSSISQPIAFAQPALIAMPGEQCEPLTLPPERELEGIETSPETPPPMARMRV